MDFKSFEEGLPIKKENYSALADSWKTQVATLLSIN